MTYYEMIGFSGGPEPSRTLPHRVDLEKTALFLDFDGTLVDIAERPDAVTVDADVKALVNELSRRTGGATVIVSGRKLEDVERYLPDFDGPIICSHGAEWRQNGERGCHAAGESEAFRHLKAMVREWANAEKKVLLEEKPCSVVLHFRQAPDRMADGLNFLNALIHQTPSFKVKHAKYALELHPADVSKGKAVTELMQRWPDRIPVAFGDDVTDECMFATVQEAGGFGVAVGDQTSCAMYRLASPAQARESLRAWLRGEEKKPWPDA